MEDEVDQHLTSNRQMYSVEMISQIPPEALVGELKRQLASTRKAISEQYRDVDIIVETISLTVEIIHHGVRIEDAE